VLLDLPATENDSDTKELLREEVEAALRGNKSGKSPGEHSGQDEGIR